MTEQLPAGAGGVWLVGVERLMVERFYAEGEHRCRFVASCKMPPATERKITMTDQTTPTPHAEQQGNCPLTHAQAMANEAAKAKLGTEVAAKFGTAEGVKKSVTSSVTLENSVTENARVKNEKIKASVTLAVESSDEEAPAEECCPPGCCDKAS
jgi:hypothetical protein